MSSTPNTYRYDLRDLARTCEKMDLSETALQVKEAIEDRIPEGALRAGVRAGLLDYVKHEVDSPSMSAAIVHLANMFIEVR
jgi:hypothetical protein